MIDDEQEKSVNIKLILEYFILWFVFACSAIAIKLSVLNALNLAQYHKISNKLFTLYEVHNSGAAFNLFSAYPKSIILASVMALLVFTLIVITSSKKLSNGYIICMSLLSAGITLNMFERIKLNYVIDYIQCNFFPSFPVFNIPDIMIVAGAIGLIIAILISKDR